jgi:dCTP diphosphatase
MWDTRRATTTLAAQRARRVVRRLGTAEVLQMSEDRLAELQRRLAAFAAARDWDQFHSPKNLAMALSVEASELLEEFQWLTEEQSSTLDAERRERVRLEMADVLIYLVRLADKLGVDLMRAAHDKLALNEHKYPAERVRGDARKYTEY